MPKAYKVYDVTSDDGCSTVVFAENAGKAKSLALSTNTCEDSSYTDIRVLRMPMLDKYYRSGKTEMNWYDPKDRIALVKLGWRCSYETYDYEECKTCAASKYCGGAIDNG